MSTVDTTPDHSPEAALSPPGPATQSQRILACVLCQQRKTRCDRKFPCAVCVKSNVQCVPATLATRQRRRRFAERDLLERLRHYENLLRSNKVPFDPLHAPSVSSAPSKGVGKSPEASTTRQHTEKQSTKEPTIKTESVFEAK